jgi:hypothetical protein
MIRFANPGSDIDGFTRIFQALYAELIHHQPFTLDDMSAALVKRNLATSCGYTGNEALQRSNREDRSRDPLCNQSKMYSELFRLLGWMHPTPDSRLSFVFTWLGAHVSEAGPQAKPLVRECVLGIAFPNQVVAAKGDYRLRPFATILRALDALDGLLCRDEMIVGPLSLLDDTRSNAVAKMITRLRSYRGRSTSKLDHAVKALSSARGIQINTLANYTRFPLAVLEWSGWTEKVRDKSAYGRFIVFHRLTSAGKQQARAISAAVDVRGDTLTAASKPTRAAAAKLGAVAMLERAGFDGSSLSGSRNEWVRALVKAGLLSAASDVLLFSPFQELDPSQARTIFGEDAATSGGATAPRKTAAATIVGRSAAVVTKVKLLPRTAPPRPARVSSLEARLRRELKEDVAVETVAARLVARFSQANKGEFYPAVAELFRCIGYDCTASRVGVNYERWDALIRHATDSVPIEIKSPGEEAFISVKGVRQALENKVILLARNAAPTRPGTTSLVVGFQAPNDRAEVAGLVSDIYKTFRVSVGIVDFRSLALLAAAAAAGRRHDSASLLSLRGFINVAAS